MKYTMDEGELQTSRFNAKLRHELNKAKGVKDRQVGRQDGLEIEVNALNAEFCVSQILNLAVDFRVGKHPDADLVLHTGLTVDVKYTPHKKGHLMVAHWKRGKPCDLYIAVTGGPVAYEVMGFAWRFEVFAPESERDFGYGPCWAVPMQKLHPLTDLPEFLQIVEVLRDAA